MVTTIDERTQAEQVWQRPYDIKDASLAEHGVLRIEWAGREMPVLAAISSRRLEMGRSSSMVAPIVRNRSNCFLASSVLPHCVSASTRRTLSDLCQGWVVPAAGAHRPREAAPPAPS